MIGMAMERLLSGAPSAAVIELSVMDVRIQQHPAFSRTGFAAATLVGPQQAVAFCAAGLSQQGSSAWGSAPVQQAPPGATWSIVALHTPVSGSTRRTSSAAA